MSQLSTNKQRYTLIPTPFDSKRTNCYIDGSNIVIETIAEYLLRIPADIRDTFIVTVMIPKVGHSAGTFPIATFSTVLADFDFKLYGFVGGLADENFVELPFSQVESFLDLTDTPDSYTGEANKFVKVKSDETGLEFITIEPNFNNTSIVITGDSTKDVTITQANGNVINTTFSVGDPLPVGTLGDVLYVDGTGDWVASNLCTLVNACLGDLYTRVDNLETTVSTQVNTSIPPVNYGYLYNWYAATDSRNIANTGWHVPTNNEWVSLGLFLDPDGDKYNNDAGGKLKETGTTYWQSPNTGATNEVGFNGRGVPHRSDVGVFSGAFVNCYFMADLWIEGYVHTPFISYNTGLLYYTPSAGRPVSTGVAVRLVKDSTTLTNGQSGTYIGNNGKVYRTICIGTQEWLADNLAETKYRDGTTIPIVTDNTAWSNLTTGARCAYNNYDPYV